MPSSTAGDGLNLESVLQKGELLWPGPFCEGAHSAGNSDSIYFRSESRFNFKTLEAKVTTLWKELTTLWKNDQSTIGGNRPVASRLSGYIQGSTSDLNQLSGLQQRARVMFCEFAWMVVPQASNSNTLMAVLMPAPEVTGPRAPQMAYTSTRPGKAFRAASLTQKSDPKDIFLILYNRLVSLRPL